MALPEILTRDLARIVETQLRLLEQITDKAIASAQGPIEAMEIHERGIRLADWYDAFQEEIKPVVLGHSVQEKDRLINKAFRCLKGENLIEQSSLRFEDGSVDFFVKLSWNGECVLDSLKQAGGLSKLFDALELKPGMWGISLDVKKLIRRLLD